jgi:lysophospholipase L1-like esterase
MTGRRKVAFAALFGVILIAAAETLAGALYYLTVPEKDQMALEVALGHRADWRSARQRFIPHPYLGYQLNPEYVSPDGTRQHSQGGWFRGKGPDEKKPALRILALGGSTTYGEAVADPKSTWPALLEEELSRTMGPDVEVLNAGVPNWTTFELLGVAAFWAPALKPDWVVVHTGFNDAFTHGYPEEGGTDNTRYRHAFRIKALPLGAGPMLRFSNVGRLLLFPWLKREGFFTDDVNAAMMHPRPRGKALHDEQKKASGAFFRRNLKNLIMLLQQSGAQVVLAPVPLAPEKSRDPGVGPYFLGAFEATRRNATLAESVAQQMGIPFVDVSPGLTENEFLDVAHLDEKGHAIKAKRVAQALLPLLQKTDPPPTP